MQQKHIICLQKVINKVYFLLQVNWQCCENTVKFSGKDDG